MPFGEIHTIQKRYGREPEMMRISNLGLLRLICLISCFPGMTLYGPLRCRPSTAKPTFKGCLSWIRRGAKKLFNKYFELGLVEILLSGLGPATMLSVLIYKNWDKVADWAKESLAKCGMVSL